MSEIALGRGRLNNLIEALLQVSALSDVNIRTTRLKEAQTRLRRQVTVRRSGDFNADVSLIVDGLAACTGGLCAFTQAVARQHPNEASKRADRLAGDLAGGALLSAPDREALRQQLIGVGVWQVADALGDLSGMADLRLWRDIPAAIRAIEQAPRPDGDTLPPLLAFTERLAHLLDAEAAQTLWQWIGVVAGGAGVSEDAVETMRSRGTDERVVATEPAGAVDRVAGRERRVADASVIWGNVPIRNRNFTGRVALLNQLGAALHTSSKASVLPQALHGTGGVGKTQLVIEYVYRHLDEYDLVWWISAEQTTTVLTSLTQLAVRLGLTPTDDRGQTARAVLDALAGSQLRWLLVYDNAGNPDDLDHYVPTTGGDVILTTRDQEWANLGPAIEVDVFAREESIELLRKRSEQRIGPEEAEQLAQRLGDLPLALEQAAAWHLATGMSIAEYIELLDSQMKELLSEGKPANYPVSVAAFVTVATDELRGSAPATCQLLELFAYLGGEPVPVSLLRNGKDADIAEPLRGLLGNTVSMNKAVRDLSRLGLAKIGVGQRVQVHRLVQSVLRETLGEERTDVTLRNVQNMLARANPGDVDEAGEEVYTRHRDLGPHLDPAGLIRSPNFDARQAVLDHARFLYVTGDFENSRILAERAAEVWEADTSDPHFGPDGTFTLLARSQIANAIRMLGNSVPAAELARDTYERMRRSPMLGPRHEYTLIMANHLGVDLRIAGKYREALDFGIEQNTLHREVFEETEVYTLRSQMNLAVAYRLVGDFAKALELDEGVAKHWEDVGGTHPNRLEAYMNMARDYYGIGAYRTGLDELERWRGPLEGLLGATHHAVLLAGRTYGITLRKAGHLQRSVAVLQENRELTLRRFGQSHEYTVAATVSYGNALRDMGDLDEALTLFEDALDVYRVYFGEANPLTLVTQVNEAIAWRAKGDLNRARELDSGCYTTLAEVLGPDHPYTLCAGASLATSHALAGEHDEAARLSVRVVELSRATSGGRQGARDEAEHPYVLMRTINLAHDLRAIGAQAEADAVFQEALSGLRVTLGASHPDVAAAERGDRLEGDVESPPT